MNVVVTARSASDKTDNWPFWMVWDGSQNITAKAFKTVTGMEWPPVLPLVRKDVAVDWAEKYNEIMRETEGG